MALCLLGLWVYHRIEPYLIRLEMLHILNLKALSNMD